MMLFTKEQIEKIKEVLNNGGKVVFKISQNRESKSIYGMYGEAVKSSILLSKMVSYDVDKFKIVLYKAISEYTFECYLLRLRKTQGKNCNYNYGDCIFTTLEFELFDSNGDYIYYNHYIVDVDYCKL